MSELILTTLHSTLFAIPAYAWTSAICSSRSTALTPTASPWLTTTDRPADRGAIVFTPVTFTRSTIRTHCLTARQALHDPAYVDYRPDAIVWMVDLGGVHDVTVGTPAVQVLPIDGNDGVNGPLYDIRVSTSLPAGLFSSSKDAYGLAFSVATCGNDLVQGALVFDAPSQMRLVAVPGVTRAIHMVHADWRRPGGSGQTGSAPPLTAFPAGS